MASEQETKTEMPVSPALSSEEGDKYDLSSPPNWSTTMQHVADHVYFGCSSAACNKELLVANGITRVLTLLGAASEQHTDVAQYYLVEVKDSQEHSGAPMKELLPAALEWLHKAVADGHNVLVHCASGISRSGTAVLAYLMKYRGTTLAEAWAHVARRRRCLLPNDTFFRLLQEWECEWRGVAEPSVSKADYGAWNLCAVTSTPDITFDRATALVSAAGGDLNAAFAMALGWEG